MLNILALSSSRVGTGGFLEQAAPVIQSFLGEGTFKVAFIPYAAVGISYTEFGERVQKALAHLSYTITVAEPDKAKEIIEDCDVIMVGGGNTFKLLHDIYSRDLLDLIQTKVQGGTPYIGWSAGANISGRTICTTNDMPIIQPKSFEAFRFLPFQINPHYLNQEVEGHNGETRDQRLTEFIQLNPHIPVVGIPEGTYLVRKGNTLTYRGIADGVLFIYDGEVKKTAIQPGGDLSHLL